MTRACPICKRPAEVADYRPFCSKRCADVDLQRWFAGVYAVTADAAGAEPAGPEVEAGRDGDDPL